MIGVAWVPVEVSYGSAEQKGGLDGSGRTQDLPEDSPKLGFGVVSWAAGSILIRSPLNLVADCAKAQGPGEVDVDVELAVDERRGGIVDSLVAALDQSGGRVWV